MSKSSKVKSFLFTSNINNYGNGYFSSSILFFAWLSISLSWGKLITLALCASFRKENLCKCEQRKCVSGTGDIHGYISSIFHIGLCILFQVNVCCIAYHPPCWNTHSATCRGEKFNYLSLYLRWKRGKTMQGYFFFSLTKRKFDFFHCLLYKSSLIAWNFEHLPPFPIKTPLFVINGNTKKRNKD